MIFGGAMVAALEDSRKGLGNYSAVVEDDALDHIARVAGGDLRTAYNALELAVLTTPPQADGKIKVTLSDAEQSIRRKLCPITRTRFTTIFLRFASL